MLTREDAEPLDVRLLGSVSSSETILFHGRPSDNTPYPDLVPHQSIVASPMPLLRHLGFTISFKSSIRLSSPPLLYIVTTLVPSTCLQIHFNTNEPSTLNMTLILVVTKWQSATSGFFMFLSNTSMQKSSLRVSHFPYFLSFDPI